MRIAIGCDHRGYDLKESLKGYLAGNGHEVKDFGTHSKDSVDYPVFAKEVAMAIATGEYNRGILICGSGIGMQIAADKIKKIRAANCRDEDDAYRSRAHNDANVLTLGADKITGDLAKRIVDKWLTTDFEAGRHQRRVDMIEEMENG
ncbi:MAG: ribose 5-phosphate isomerase B [Candidatus Aenigmatarchaeota archaeon]